jgi:hypothetical protein
MSEPLEAMIAPHPDPAAQPNRVTAMLKDANTHFTANAGLGLVVVALCLHIAHDLVSKGAWTPPLALAVILADMDDYLSPVATAIGGLGAYFGRPKSVAS